MGEVSIPEVVGTPRRRTRPYDAPSGSIPDVLSAVLQLLPPPGGLLPTFLEEQPEGGAWILCNGQWLQKADFPRLFEITGGRFGENETEFQVPDLRGRTVIGAQSIDDLGEAVGQSEITLSLAQLPAHSHDVNDQGHTHDFTPETHTHEVTDPGHIHQSATVGGSVTVAAGSDIEINLAKSGVTEPQTGGITLEPASAGGEVERHITGISVGSAGSGQAIDITPAGFTVNWMVRA